MLVVIKNEFKNIISMSISIMVAIHFIEEKIVSYEMSSFTFFLLKMLKESLIRVLKLDSWCHQLDTCMVHTHKYVNRINIRDLSEKIDSQQKKTFNRWIFSLLASFLQIDKKEWEKKFYLWKPTMESNCRIHAKTMIRWIEVKYIKMYKIS